MPSAPSLNTTQMIGRLYCIAVDSAFTVIMYPPSPVTLTTGRPEIRDLESHRRRQSPAHARRAARAEERVRLLRLEQVRHPRPVVPRVQRVHRVRRHRFLQDPHQPLRQHRRRVGVQPRVLVEPGVSLPSWQRARPTHSGCPAVDPDSSADASTNCPRMLPASPIRPSSTGKVQPGVSGRQCQSG